MIIENLKSYNIFLEYWNTEPSIVIPVMCDLEKHTMNTSLSFLYIRFRDEQVDDGVAPIHFILPYNHNDCRKLDFDVDLSTSNQPKLVYDKKRVLQLNLGIKNTYDLRSEYYFEGKSLKVLDEYIFDLTKFYKSNGLFDNLGKSIPIVVLLDKLKGYTDNLSFEVHDSWINSVMIPTLSKLETRGIRVNREKFIEKWNHSGKHLNGDVVYTNYNIYTATSRPSNSHGGVNFAAINKKDGSREIFIPRDGNLFLQFDYDAYHVRIIGDLINYELPKTSVHQYLADIYGVSYSESKGITFKILYGGIPDELKEIEFFKKTDIFINELWERGNRDGYVTTLQGRKIYLSMIENINSQKLFNYYLQATETEYNIDVIRKLYENGIETMNLYTYDSFLFEYGLNDSPETAIKIKEILESNGFPVKVSWGSDYSKV